jgi:TonB-linked SusC/RagA family outer membrane protein
MKIKKKKEKDCFYKQLKKLLLVMAFYTIPILASAQLTVKGVVTDADTQEELPGVAIRASKTAVVTDVKGQFSISVSKGDELTFSYLGYKNHVHKVVGNETVLKIALVTEAKQLGEVVVQAGIIQRNKLGFTGSYTSISNEELKSTGNINIIQSLKSLDPAFVIVENALSGSNPNMMANIELRGQTTMNISSIQDAATVASNLPLFVLDGFEATLQEINDLDINRVESVTLLKDAGSTAIYGSKGANGVVVIETIRPKAGQVFISYSGDFQLATPDLSAYNMMNAAEKLEFERLAGRYNYNSTDQSDVSEPTLGGNQASYYERLAKVQSGVDSYWLSEPVRTAFTQGHSLAISGGDKDLLYTVGINYKHNPGVMKASFRDSYGGNVKLVYRGVSGLSLLNNTFFSGTNAEDGSWGSFSDFVNANPYYEKRNADGSISKYLDRYLDITTSSIAVNPLYNASLNTRHDSKIYSINNNTSADWQITENLLWKANLSLRRGSTNKVDFIDPSHSRFDNDTYDKKGSYTSAYISSWSYSVNTSLNYLKSVQKHNFTLIGRYSMEETNNTAESLSAYGFPEGAVGYPSYAFSYETDSRPSYSERKTRGLTLIGAFNYNYNYRYLFDLNYNMDGSTNFGKNNRYQSFWSAGLGWNVHREEFVKDWEWLNELKLRGTFGTNGNQDVNVVTNSVYTFYVGSNLFGQSAYLSQVGNPDLRWQVVEKEGAGIDAGFLNGNLRFNFDVYKHHTDPQIVVLDQRPSTGVSGYPLNLGYLTTKGYEFKIMYNIINDAKNDIVLSLRFTGGHNESVYGGFEESLKNLNEAYKKEENSNLSLNSLQNYMDGYSPSDLWAVRSLGIDPASGRELFLKKDGAPTFIYDPDDRVVIANSRPDIEGIFGFTLRVKKLILNANFRYYEGAYTYNSALFNKVENISSSQVIYNQDKRALYERWHEAGDITQFKRLSMGRTDADRTPVSSRFIQKNNYIRGESAKLTWNFTGDKWLNSLKLKDFSMSLAMEDFFNLNSIKIERGIDYPFQRAVVMNLSARF